MEFRNAIRVFILAATASLLVTSACRTRKGKMDREAGVVPAAETAVPGAGPYDREIAILSRDGDEATREGAFNQLLKAGPSAEIAVPALLALGRRQGARRDKGEAAVFATVIAAVGPRAVPHLVKAIKKAALIKDDEGVFETAGFAVHGLLSSKDEKKLRSARNGKMRKALAPLSGKLVQRLLHKRPPGGGVAMACAALGRPVLKLLLKRYTPVTADRIALVISLMFSERVKDSAVFPPEDRKRLRAAAAPLAPRLVKALTGPKGSDLTPQSMVWGLGALGKPAAAPLGKAMVRSPKKVCKVGVAAFGELATWFGPAQVTPYLRTLVGCAVHLSGTNQMSLGALLAAVGPPALNAVLSGLKQATQKPARWPSGWYRVYLTKMGRRAQPLSKALNQLAASAHKAGKTHHTEAVKDCLRAIASEPVPGSARAPARKPERHKHKHQH